MKISRKVLICSVVLSLLLSSCSAFGEPEPTSTPEPSSTPVPTSTPTLTPTPTPIGSGQGQIVFIGEETIDGVTYSNIYSINVDGTGRINLTNNTNLSVQYLSPKYSPDGNLIAFCRIENTSVLGGQKAEVFTMDIEGNNVQKITTSKMYSGNKDVSDDIAECYPSWSPDGTKLTVTSNRDTLKPNDFEIYIIDLQTFEGEKITEKRNQSMNSDWSPDGKKICFMSNRYGDWDLFTYDLETEELFQVTSSKATERFPSWSHDGGKIVFHSDESGNPELYTINSDGTDLKKITNNPAQDETARWSNDDQWIVFQSDRDGDRELFIIKSDGSEEVKITNNSFTDATADWAP